MSKIIFDRDNKKELCDLTDDLSGYDSRTTITMKKVYPKHIKLLLNNTYIAKDVINIINEYLIDIFDIEIEYNIADTMCTFNIGKEAHFYFIIKANNISISLDNYSFTFEYCIKFNTYAGAHYTCSLTPYSIDNQTIIYKSACTRYDNMSAYHDNLQALNIIFKHLDEYFTKINNFKESKFACINTNCDMLFDVNLFFNMYMKDVYDKKNYINYNNKARVKTKYGTYEIERVCCINGTYKQILLDDNNAYLLVYNIVNHRKLKNVIVIMKQIVEIINNRMKKICYSNKLSKLANNFYYRDEEEEIE